MIEENLEQLETGKNIKYSREEQNFKRHKNSSQGPGFVTYETSETEMETLQRETADLR